jgi:hypothetical protein
MRKGVITKSVLKKFIAVAISLVFMIYFFEDVIINWIPFTLGLAGAIVVIILVKKKEAGKIILFSLATLAGTMIIALGLAMFLPQFGLGMGFSVKDKLTPEQAGAPREEAINNGWISEAGDYIFYVKPESVTMQSDHPKDKLIRRNLDWTDKIELTENLVSYFIVNEDLIYFADASNDNHLYSMNFDGSEKALVIDKSIYACAVDKDTIYYSTLDGLFRMNLDGTNEIKLQSKGGYPIIFDEWVYYSNSADTLSRVNKNGSDDRQLLSDIDGYFISEDSIHYFKLTEHIDKYGYQLRLYSSSLDGSQEKEIKTIDQVAQAMFSEGFLYCQMLKDDGRVEKGIFKVSLDDAETIRSSKAIMWQWDAILGDWAYALQYSGDRYRIKLDENVGVRFE